MQTMNSTPTKTRFAVVIATTLLSAGLFAACSSKPSDQNEIALTEATQKAEEATARAEAAQKALADAQAEQKAAQDRAAASQVQADAASKLKAAEARAAHAEADAAAAKRRAAAAERRPASVASSQPAAQPKPVCYDCGTVSSVVPVTVQGEGTGMGAVAGAIAGAVIGHQFGRGQGNKVAEAAGAIAGGYGGNVAEKHIRGSTVYDVTVSLDNGGSRVVRVGDAAGISTGERVRIEGTNIVRL